MTCETYAVERGSKRRASLNGAACGAGYAKIAQ
jgi:hypothetical protein